jgi:hypothetical protein
MIRIQIVGRITADDQHHDHVLGMTEADNYPDLALAVGRLLNEIADTWPQVVAEGILS